MKCSKCGKQIKNLPDYMEDMEAEFLCSTCAGTAQRGDEAVYLFDYYRSRGATYTSSESGTEEMEIAA